MRKDDTPHLRVAQIMRNAVIKPAICALWYFSPTGLPPSTNLFCLLVFLLLKRIVRKMQNHNNVPFPFLRLPPELRDMVYENLLEDPHYPPPRPCPKRRAPGWLPSMSQSGSSDGEDTGHKSNFIFLANKQIYAEYMDLMCKKSTFHLTVTPQNYGQSATPADGKKRIWQISPQILKKIRRCDIKLDTTSTMLGVSDPRNMKPEEWALSRQMRCELSHMESVVEMNLLVKAITDPLWNPLWMWYHATQALRTMGSASDREQELTASATTDHKRTASTEEKPSQRSEPSGGAQFSRIIFSLDQWSPGENYLKRDPDSGEWSWWCLKGHCVAPVGAELTVRQFCGRLYECDICHPEDEEEE